MADPRPLPPLEDLNAMPAAQFARALAPLFEAPGDAPFLRILADRRPFAADAALFAAAREALAGRPDAEKRAALDGHAPVGADPEAVRRRSATSYREQGYGSAASGSAAPRSAAPQSAVRTRAREDLERLNAAYRERFGFTFVVFVNRRPPEALVPVLRARLARTIEEETAAGLSELVAIAEDRARALREIG